MKNLDNALVYLKKISEELSYDKICEYTEEQKIQYKKLLKELKDVNNSKKSNTEKGTILEEIAVFLLKTGNIFEIYNNVRTSTNELDQLVRVNATGKLLCTTGIISNKFRNFIGECKNHNEKISVTYVGKICSLLCTTNIKICILFSYHGVTGNNWQDASGLIKKFYLCREKEEDRYCIIDFNINDFNRIEKGENFLQILEEKMNTLQYDTDYIKYISDHENSQKISNTIEVNYV